MESYDRHSKKPRFLSCGHGFCEACLQELLLTKGSSLTCPNCRKVTSHVYDIKCLPAAEEHGRSLDLIRNYNTLAEQAQSLQKEMGSLQTMIDDYQQYLKKTQKTNQSAGEGLRLGFEQEYGKINEAANKLVTILEEHKGKLSAKLMSNMLVQQQTLIKQNKDIEDRQEKLARLDAEILNVTQEAEKYCEEQKLSGDDESEFKKLKERFIELTVEFEGLLRFPHKATLISQHVVANFHEAAAALESFKLSEQISEPLHQETAELSAETLPLFEKVQQIKHPTVTFFAVRMPGVCTVVSYNTVTEGFAKDEAKLWSDFDVRECEAVTHPNGNCVFLVSGGRIVLYDCLNKLFLKKPCNSACIGVKGCATAFLDNYIYVIGGTKDCKVQPTTSRYNVVTEKWVPMSPLHVERHSASACPINDYQVCVAGGENNAEAVLGSIEILNVQMNSWELATLTLKIPRKGLSIVSLEKDRIIVCGGEGLSKSVVDVVEELDMLKNAGITLESPAEPRKNAKALPMGNCLYMFGGQAEKPSMVFGEKYCMNENKWLIIEASSGLAGLIDAQCPAALVYE